MSLFLCFVETFNSLFLIFKVDENGTIFTNDSFTVSLHEKTLFEASCDLVYATSESWFTEFDFSITNDGEKFTEKYSVYVYQSQCQILKNESGIISITLQVSVSLLMWYRFCVWVLFQRCNIFCFYTVKILPKTLTSWCKYVLY